MPGKTGLLQIHSPSKATVDIVLLHGLFGDPIKTWTYESIRRSVFWPSDLLPKDVPPARILSFGYDANIAHFWSRPSDNRLDAFSDDLFQQLNDYRYNSATTGRPIIFVAHSLGGLVIANALVDAASGLSTLQDVSQSIRRIAFLGTPHDGSEKARWAETGRRFLSIFKSTNKELSKDLTPKSEKLAKLGVQFPILLSKRAQNPATFIDVVCFYEGLSTRRIGLNLDVIVSEYSACLPGYQRTLMEADHQNMVRFKSRDYRNYQRLVGTLQRWVKELDVPADDINVVARPSIWFSQNVVQTPLPQNTAPLELDANPSLTPRQSVPLSMVTDEDLYSQSDVPQSGLRHVRQSQRIPRQPTSQSSHQRQETCQLPKNTTTAVDQTLEVESEDYSDVEEEEEEEEVVLPPPHPKRASRPQISQTQGLSVPIVIPPDLSKLGSVIFQGTSQLQMAYNMGTMNLSFHS